MNSSSIRIKDNYDFFSSSEDIRFFATIGVIILHVSAPILYNYNELNRSHWFIGNVFDSICHVSVPFFVMLSGSLLLSKKYVLKDFVKKRFFKIIFPFLFWSLIYIMKNLYVVFYGTNSFSIKDIAFSILEQLQIGASFHFWYIYMIIGLYLFVPIISKFIENSNINEINYFLAIWFFTLIMNLNILYTKIDFSYFSGYLGYFILGYYLENHFNISQKKSVFYITLFFIGLSVTVFGTYYMTVSNQHYNELFYNNLSPNICLSSIGLYCYIKSFHFKGAIYLKIRSLVCKYSYGIYLVHILILLILNKIGINGELLNPIIGIPITSIICLIISLSIIYLINKFPFGKYVSG